MRLLRSMPLLILLVPACAEPTAATAPEPAPEPALAATPQPPGPDNIAPPPREVKPRKPVDNTRATDGRQLFLKLQYANCHTGAANAKGPSLEALYGSKVALAGDAVTTADDAYLVESIRKPKAKVVEGWVPVMPAYDETQATAEEVNALVAYIRSLRAGDLKPEGDVSPPPVGAPTGK